MKNTRSVRLRAVLSGAFIVFLLTSLSSRASTMLTFAHIYPPQHPSARACQRFADLVNKRSEGRLRITLYEDASAGNQGAILQSMKNSSLDFSVLSHGVVAEAIPEFNALGLPYLFSDPVKAWRVLDGEIGQQLMQKSAASGLVVLSFWDVEVRHISNSLRRITQPGDMAGLRIRTPPDALAVDIISALGARPLQINFSDLRKALEEGVADGQDNPLISFEASRLYEVQKFISLTAHKYSIHSLLMSRMSWDDLSADDRAMVLQSAKEAARYQRALSREAETLAYRALQERGVRISRVETRPFIEATAGIYDKWYASPVGHFVRTVVKAARSQP